MDTLSIKMRYFTGYSFSGTNEYFQGCLGCLGCLSEIMIMNRIGQSRLPYFDYSARGHVLKALACEKQEE